MSARNAIRRIGLVGLTVIGGSLMFTAGPATAFMGYGEATFFGVAGSGNGQFADPTGVAVDDSSNDLYVVDQGNNRVQKFEADGKYLLQFNGSENPLFPLGFNSPNVVAVDNSAGISKGDVYVVDSGDNVIDKFSASGTFLFELSGFASPVIGVAVTPSGDVWVAESSGSLQKFDGAGKNALIGSITPEFGRSPGVAVDSKENIYLLRGEPNVAKFTNAGTTLEEQITHCGCITGIAVDPTNDDLLADEGSSIGSYPSADGPYFNSSPIETLEGISSSKGVGVNGATHTVYATQSETDTVAIFKFVLLPDVITGATSEIHRTSAKLEGEVNPDGQEATSCQFEYGTSESYGHTALCTSAPGAGSSPVAESGEANDLSPETTYHYRLIAGNANGVHRGADRTFTTSPAVEGVLTGAATELQGTSAVLNGSLEPNGYDTHYLFEYGLVGSYSSATANEDAGSAIEDKLVNTKVSGLEPHQAYDFRIVAENVFGKTAGGESVFATPVVVPQIPGSPNASFVTSQRADIEASVNPEHTATRYHFEYGACPVLAGCPTVLSTPDQESSLYGIVGSTSEISGLTPSTTYSYRLVANNEFEEAMKMVGGSTTGVEGRFTTASAPAPGAETDGYAAVTSTSAVIFGAVDPDGLPAGYAFELGIYDGADTQYTIVYSGPAGSSSAPVQEELALTGLQPGTTYAYRIAVSSGYISNESHTLPGAPVTFTTAGLPAILASPVPLAMLPLPPIRFPTAAKPIPKCKRGFARDKRGKCVTQPSKKKRGKKKKRR